METIYNTGKSVVDGVNQNSGSLLTRWFDNTKANMLYNSYEAQLDRQFNAYEAQLSRDFNRQEAEIARQFSADEAQRNRDFQLFTSNTAYQRGVEDMRKAGLNPYLAYNQGGASTPVGSSAQSFAGSSSPASKGSTPSPGSGSNMTGLLSSALNLVGRAMIAGAVGGRSYSRNSIGFGSK